MTSTADRYRGARQARRITAFASVLTLSLATQVRAQGGTALAEPGGIALVRDSASALVRNLMSRRTQGRRPDGTAVDFTLRAPGIAAAVVRDGQIVWSGGFGLADVERGVPATAQTRFRIGSVSKLITVAALMTLVDAKAIDLDAPIQRYVTSFPKKTFDVSARQLAGHIAGIRHYLPNDAIGHQSFSTLEAGLAVFKDSPLLSEPGTKYFYSSYGYNLLGMAVAGAAKEPFTAFVNRSVLTPLALTATVPDYRDSIIVNRTSFYEVGRDGRVVNAEYEDLSYKWPSGGFLSTVEDLARFGAVHLQPGFLSASALQLVFTPQRLRDGTSTGVGIGWRIGADSAGRRIYHHGGASTGGRAFLLVYPDERIVVALAANAQLPFNEHDAAKLAALFFSSAMPKTSR